MGKNSLEIIFGAFSFRSELIFEKQISLKIFLDSIFDARVAISQMLRKTTGIEYAILSLFSDCTFNVEIIKGPRGLGLSVSGGIDSSAPYPGLVRIKRLFPHQAAWATGQLQPGDILLEANGIILTGLTNNVRNRVSLISDKSLC